MSVDELKSFRSELIMRRAKRFENWVPMYDTDRQQMVFSDYLWNTKIVHAIRWCKANLKSTWDCDSCNKQSFETLEALVKYHMQTKKIIYFGAIINALPSAQHRYRNNLIIKLANGSRRGAKFDPNYQLLRCLIRSVNVSDSNVKQIDNNMRSAFMDELSMSLTPEGFITESGANCVIQAFLQRNGSTYEYVPNVTREFQMWRRLHLASTPTFDCPRYVWSCGERIDQYILSATPIARLGSVLLREKNHYLLQSRYADNQLTVAWKTKQRKRVMLARAADIGIVFAWLLKTRKLIVPDAHKIMNIVINAEINTECRYGVEVDMIDSIVESALVAIVRHLD